MYLRFVFFLITRIAAWLRLSRREVAWKTAEILILRHQLAVLQRRQPHRPKLNWGGLFLHWLFGNVEHLGATLQGPGYQDWQALLMEIVLTALLVSVILGTASAAQNVGAIAALGVGGYIALAGLWAAPVSGVSMNPARQPLRGGRCGRDRRGGQGGRNPV